MPDPELPPPDRTPELAFQVPPLEWAAKLLPPKCSVTVEFFPPTAICRATMKLCDLGSKLIAVPAGFDAFSFPAANPSFTRRASRRGVSAR